MVKKAFRSSSITVKDLPSLRKKYRTKRIVFCSGCFDLTHAGHVLFFEDCKKQGDVLVVGISADKGIRKYKKGRPVLNEHLRLRMVASLKPVDYAFVHPTTSFETDDQMNDFLHEVFAKLRPDVYVINNDANGIPHRKEIMREHPYVQMRILKRAAPKKFEKVSTSSIIEKIRKLA